MAARITPNPGDRPRRLRLLHLLADACGTKADLAEEIGVGRTTVSQWFSGAREVEEWHVILAAAARVIRHHPEHEARIVQVIAGELLDVQGAWLPALGQEEASKIDAWIDATQTAARGLGAARRGDADEERQASRDLANQAIGLTARSAA